MINLGCNGNAGDSGKIDFGQSLPFKTHIFVEAGAVPRVGGVIPQEIAVFPESAASGLPPGDPTDGHFSANLSP